MKAKASQCSIVTCGRPAICRGWCHAHYQRWYRTGNVEADKPLIKEQRQCAIEGCDEPHYARGWCQRHWGRWRRSGDPVEPALRRNRPKPSALSSKELITLLGISYRQLDYWTRRGYINPTVQANGSGTRRWWLLDDVMIVRDLQRRIEECPFDHPHIVASPKRMTNV